MTLGCFCASACSTAAPSAAGARSERIMMWLQGPGRKLRGWRKSHRRSWTAQIVVTAVGNHADNFIDGRGIVSFRIGAQRLPDRISGAEELPNESFIHHRNPGRRSRVLQAEPASAQHGNVERRKIFRTHPCEP